MALRCRLVPGRATHLGSGLAANWRACSASDRKPLGDEQREAGFAARGGGHAIEPLAPWGELCRAGPVPLAAPAVSGIGRPEPRPGERGRRAATRTATRSVYLVGLLAAPPRGITGLGGVDAVGLSCTTIRFGCLTIIVSAPPSLAFPLGHLLVVASHGIAGRRLHVPLVGSFVTIARSLVTPGRPDAQGIADAIWIEAQLGGTLDEGRNVRWGALLRSVHTERLPANFGAQTNGSLSPTRSLSARLPGVPSVSLRLPADTHACDRPSLGRMGLPWRYASGPV